MKKIALTVTAFLLVSIMLIGQNIERKYINHDWKGDQIKVTTNDGYYLIGFYSDKIIETSFIPTIDTKNKDSHAVILKEYKRGDILSFENSIDYLRGDLRVQIQKTPFQISYFYKSTPIISEKEGYHKNDTHEILDFNLTDDEILYGGGNRILGMDRRGHRLELYNRAHYGYTTESELMNFTMPIVVSSKQYMIHFDNAPRGFLDLDSKGDNTLAYETISGRKTYQVIVGDSWEDMLFEYTRLTGRQPLPPRWVFGNFSSRFGYHSEAEVRNTIDQFIEDKIPVDAVIIDIYWFGKDIKGHMGNLEFLKDSFPTPYKMIANLKAKGVKTILITEPFILTTSNRWDEAVEKKLLGKKADGSPYTYDFYFGNTGIIDIYDPEVEQWFWNVYKKFTAKGVAGWWGDLGEPEVHPSDLLHATGTADEVHNIYGHDWARLIYEGYQRDFPEQRPFILMRAGYSGSQRYGMIPWTGDVSRSWGGLQPQTELSLQMGLQGMAYMHSDLGGFAGGDIFDPELYTRWLQYGIFQPIYRPHAQEHIAPEPVFHDDKTKALAKASIEMRYRLMPYIYNMAFENSNTGIPMMRPLFFEEPENKAYYEVATTYLWGNDLLVAPITEAGQKTKEVHFPKGEWYDFYTGKTYQGGKMIHVAVEEDHIPVFVRDGAFIPMVKTQQNTDNYSTKELELHYYPTEASSNTKRSMYDDDGHTPDAYAKGAYEMLQFEGTISDKKTTLTCSTTLGKNYTAINREMTFVIHHSKRPTKVKIGCKKVDFDYDDEAKTITVKAYWKAGKKLKLKLDY